MINAEDDSTDRSSNCGSSFSDKDHPCIALLITIINHFIELPSLIMKRFSTALHCMILIFLMHILVTYSANEVYIYSQII